MILGKRFTRTGLGSVSVRRKLSTIGGMSEAYYGTLETFSGEAIPLFIKEFTSPKRIPDDVVGPHLDAQRAVNDCFIRKQYDLFNAIRSIKDQREQRLIHFFDFFVFESTYYAVYEFQDEESEDLSRNRPITQKLYPLLDVATALSRLHDVAVIHADVKPGNIFVQLGADERGGDSAAHEDRVFRARLIDYDGGFTIRHVPPSEYHLISHDEQFCAPELLRYIYEDDPVDDSATRARTLTPKLDVFSYCMCAYAILTGEDGPKQPAYQMLAHGAQTHELFDLENEALPSDLRGLIARGLSEAPEARPTASELRDALRKKLKGRIARPKKTSAFERLSALIGGSGKPEASKAAKASAEASAASPSALQLGGAQGGARVDARRDQSGAPAPAAQLGRGPVSLGPAMKRGAGAKGAVKINDGRPAGRGAIRLRGGGEPRGRGPGDRRR
ncbi:MAG: hypothetical protein AAFV51_05465 [Pseudomonadota bacterium]